MDTARDTAIRRLVLIRPARADASGVRRLLLARRSDALLPVPRGRPAGGVARVR